MKRTLNEIVSDADTRAHLEKLFTPKYEVKGPEECWPWVARATHPFGYGRMSFGRKTYLKAHRVAFALANGPIPDGKHVLHRCDNPSCCNPAHLFLGIHQDNTKDMRDKGRGSNPPTKFGEDHHNTKFSRDDAIRIAMDRRPARVIAAEFGISQMTVYRLRKGKTWKELQA